MQYSIRRLGTMYISDFPCPPSKEEVIELCRVIRSSQHTWKFIVSGKGPDFAIFPLMGEVEESNGLYLAYPLSIAVNADEEEFDSILCHELGHMYISMNREELIRRLEGIEIELSAWSWAEQHGEINKDQMWASVASYVNSLLAVRERLLVGG